MNYDMVGPVLALGISAIGSCVGCYIAGSASHAALGKSEEGHAKFIAMASAPSSQMLYGFILMLFMRNAIHAGTLDPFAALFIGGVIGLALAVSAIYQGMVCATGIQTILKQPDLFAKCFIAIGVIESFALFALAFSLMLLQ